MSKETIYIVDEVTDQGTIVTNPLLSPALEMEDYIEVKSKTLPGKKEVFNNMPDMVTREVNVTGLVLNFSQDLSQSKLKALPGKIDIEYLSLYADTIILGDKLTFPQTNITICCRQLIIEPNGSLSTVPIPFQLPYAAGAGGKDRNPGAEGCGGGNLIIYSQTIENKRTDDEFVFTLTGSQGQGGEPGGIPSDDSKTEGYPLSWTDIEKTIINNDVISGNRDNWAWPDIPEADKHLIYYAAIEATNFVYFPENEKRYYKTTLGNKDLKNLDNGKDAVVSGNGGRGGKGGSIKYLDFKTIGKNINWQLKGGDSGVSKVAEGGKKKDSTYYHVEIRAFHKDINYDWNKNDQNGHLKPSFTPYFNITKRLISEDGKPSKGKDGESGENGTAEKLASEKFSWLSPVLLESVIQFAKTSFRDGERGKAKWVFDQYSEAVNTLPLNLKEDLQMASLIREMELYKKRIDQNLDFYGYPPGWIPRLSALSNLSVLTDSRRDLASLIYFANRLLKEDEDLNSQKNNIDWAIKDLQKNMDIARKDVVTAFGEIPDVKKKINDVEKQISGQLLALRNLKKKIESEAEQQQKEQLIFSGAFEILGGICSLIPVGQPYVGQLGGTIMNTIGKIDINADNPIKEGLSFAGDLSGEVGDFFKKNEKAFKEDITSGFAKEIEKGTKELNDYNSQIDDTKKELKQAEEEVKASFSDRDIAILRAEIKGIQTKSQDGSGAGENDLAAILASVDELKESISNSKSIANNKKQELSTKLSSLEAAKKPLADKLKNRKKEKEKREKNVKTAGKVIKGFTEGLSGITSGIQKMMVDFDENDEEVQKRVEKLKKSKYKTDFEKIYDKIAEINKVKLPLVERLLKLEQKINNGVQVITNGMLQWTILNDQQVALEYGLLPSTRNYLKRMAQDSWDMLMQECYYFTRSYQYRFLKKIDPVSHGVKTLITDIEKFRNGKDPRQMSSEAFQELFDNVLKSQFKRLAYDLLVKLQETSAGIREDISTIVLDVNEKNFNNDLILERLNTLGQAEFYLKDMKSSKKGTDQWMQYKIVKITFLSIIVESANPNASFDFGIRHSGDSLILGGDKKRYFFTSRSATQPSGSKKLKVKAGSGITPIDLQVKSWNASYNGADRDKPNGGLNNAKDSKEDEILLKKLLREFDLEKAYESNQEPYKDHYPGGTSLLSLIIYSDEKDIDFKIKELKFQVDYEVLR